MQNNVFPIVNAGHVVNLLAPIDVDGGIVYSDCFHMKRHTHASIIIQIGVSGTPAAITLLECIDSTGHSGTSTSIPFNYYKCEVGAGAAGSDIFTEYATTVTTAGFTPATTDNIMYVIELESSSLSDGYEWVQIANADPSGSTIMSMVAVLSGSRYAQMQSDGDTAAISQAINSVIV